MATSDDHCCVYYPLVTSLAPPTLWMLTQGLLLPCQHNVIYNNYMKIHVHVVFIVAGMRVHERVHTRAAIASHRVLPCHSVESHDVSSSLSGDRSPL